MSKDNGGLLPRVCGSSNGKTTESVTHRRELAEICVDWLGGSAGTAYLFDPSRNQVILVATEPDASSAVPIEVASGITAYAREGQLRVNPEACEELELVSSRPDRAFWATNTISCHGICPQLGSSRSNQTELTGRDRA